MGEHKSNAQAVAKAAAAAKSKEDSIKMAIMQKRNSIAEGVIFSLCRANEQRLSEKGVVDFAFNVADEVIKREFAVNVTIEQAE